MWNIKFLFIITMKNPPTPLFPYDKIRLEQRIFIYHNNEKPT